MLDEMIMTREDVERIDATNIRQIYAQYADILDYRQKLYEYYEKQEDTKLALESPTDFNVFAPIARYATNIAAGYFIGKPCKYYSRVTQTVSEKPLLNGGKRIEIKNQFDAVGNETPEEKKKHEEINIYLTVYHAVLRRNHEDDENMALARDCMIHRVAYERVYVVKNGKTPDIRFKNIDPKKCIAIKDTSIERDIIAFICKETFVDPFTSRSVDRYELITENRHRYYEFGPMYVGGNIPRGTNNNGDYEPIREYDADEETLNLQRIVGIPIIEYNMPEGKCFFEDCIPLINARDALLNNLRNTFKYNDEAILLLIGYMKPTSNEDMEALRENIDNFKMLFLGEDNKVAWLLKDVPIESVNGYYNILTQDIFGMLGIKNPCKQSEVYQNITTVRYQNYGMENTVIGLERTFERSLLQGRARIITEILNYINNTKWDWEVLDVAFERNLPTSRTEEAQFIAQMKAADVLADEDILDQVSFIEDTDAAVRRKMAQDQREAEQMADTMLRSANPHATLEEDVTNDRRMDKDDGRLQNSRQEAE